MVLGSRCQVTKGNSNLQTRLYGRSPVCSLLGDPGGQSLHKLIKHVWRYSHEVLEGSWVFISELHHQTVIQALLWSSSDPVSDPDSPDLLSSPASSSPGQHLMKLHHLGILVLQQEHHNISSLRVHSDMDPLAARSGMAKVPEMAAFICQKSYASSQ